MEITLGRHAGNAEQERGSILRHCPRDPHSVPPLESLQGSEANAFPEASDHVGIIRLTQAITEKRLFYCHNHDLTRYSPDPSSIMSTSMRDKVALITAGSAGLGKATAHALASTQMRVVINYSENSERAEQCIKELCKIHESDGIVAATETRFLAIKADVSKRSEAKRLVHDTVAEMGRLDVVFSNHGWTKPTVLTNLDENVNEEDWDRAFNMNVKSHLFLMHAAREHLEATKGTFITTASTAGVGVVGSSVVSCLLSHTICGYTYWRTGIRCHQICSDPPCQMSCCDSKSEHTSQLCFSFNDAHCMCLARIRPLARANRAAGLECRFPSSEERRLGQENQIGQISDG